MKLLSGNSNPLLAQSIATYLGLELVQTNVTHFADSEINVELADGLKNQDCVLIQSIAPSVNASVNDNLVEMYFMVDALRRIPAKSITVVIPYFGYARQDRRVFPQSPISSKVIAEQIEALGVNRLIIMDIHAEQILGFFDIPTENIYALPCLLEDMKKFCPKLDKVCIVSPDAGAAKRARFASEILGCDYAVIEKKRPKPGQSRVMNVVGDIEGRDCILLDDMIDSAGTLCNAANALMERGANSVRAYATHGIFSGKAFEKIDKSAFEEVVVTDTICNTEKNFLSPKIRKVSVVSILGDAIKSAFED